MPENPMPFKAGDEWHPERSGGDPSLLPDTTGFSPWSGSCAPGITHTPSFWQECLK